MKLFVPPMKCPNTIKEQLQQSFEVFFCDVGAAANHVRQAVEEMLSHAGFSSRNSDGKFIELGKRISSFEEVDPENAERASALRWIGNFGSHPEDLTKDDLFNAYDILDVLLEDLYVGHHRSVRTLVDQINESKGPKK